MKPIPDLTSFIAALAQDTKSALESKSPVALAALDERRHQLLAHHLGFAPRQPIDPVFVVGDSHTLFFAGENGLNQVKRRRVGFWRPRHITCGLDLLPCFQVRHLGPATAWRASDRGSSTYAREKLDALLRYELHPGRRVLLSFGEIDCRCHIPKSVMAGTPVQEAVRPTIERLLKLVKHLQSHELQVAVWGPAMVTSQTATIAGNPLAVVGSYELRTEVVRAFCVALQKACAKVGIPCVCLAGTYHAWGEPAAPEFFSDGFHLSQRLMPAALKALLDSGALALQTNSAMPTASRANAN